MAKINIRDRNKGTGRQPNWEYRFECAPVAGKRQCATKSGFRTKKEALEAGAKALAEYEGAGSLIRESKISVADYFDLWMEQSCKMNSKYRTLEHYNDIIHRYIFPALGKYKLVSLTPLIIQDFINSFATLNLSASYVSAILSLVRTSLDYAVFPLQYIKTNPCEYVRVPRAIRNKPARIRNVITQEEFNVVMELYPEGSKWHIPLLLGWYNGMRRNEVFGLLWEDIDFEKKTISITRQYERSYYDTDGSYVIQVSKPKYDSSRVVAIGSNFIEELRAEQYRQRVMLMRNTKAYVSFLTDDNRLVQVAKNSLGNVQFEMRQVVHPVCINQDGKILYNKSVEAVCSNISRQINKHISFHCFRHSNTTYLYEAGAPLKAIQARLGHKSTKTTYGTYTHTTQTMDEVATELMEKSLEDK